MWRVWPAAAAAFVCLAGTSAAQSTDGDSAFAGRPDFKVIARGPGQAWGASWGACSVTAAIEAALVRCRASLRSQGEAGTCHITTLGDRDVDGLVHRDMTETTDRYRYAVEGGWRAQTRNSARAIEFTAYAGDATGWDEFITGLLRYVSEAPCMTDIDVGGPSVRCSGFGRFVGHLHADTQYPVFGETVLTCSNDEVLKGEYVSLEPGRGFACVVTPAGGRVMAVFGQGSHTIAKTRREFTQAYDSMVGAAGLDRDLCGWDLLIS